MSSYTPVLTMSLEEGMEIIVRYGLEAEKREVGQQILAGDYTVEMPVNPEGLYYEMEVAIQKYASWRKQGEPVSALPAVVRAAQEALFSRKVTQDHASLPIGSWGGKPLRGWNVTFAIHGESAEGSLTVGDYTTAYELKGTFGRSQSSSVYVKNIEFVGLEASEQEK